MYKTYLFQEYRQYINFYIYYTFADYVTFNCIIYFQVNPDSGSLPDMALASLQRSRDLRNEALLLNKSKFLDKSTQQANLHREWGGRGWYRDSRARIPHCA